MDASNSQHPSNPSHFISLAVPKKTHSPIPPTTPSTRLPKHPQPTAPLLPRSFSSPCKSRGRKSLKAEEGCRNSMCAEQENESSGKEERDKEIDASFPSPPLSLHLLRRPHPPPYHPDFKTPTPNPIAEVLGAEKEDLSRERTEGWMKEQIRRGRGFSDEETRVRVSFWRYFKNAPNPIFQTFFVFWGIFQTSPLPPPQLPSP